ncbi:MAG: glucose-6-phosphate isomerase [Pseudomonadota bacterium]
MSNDAKLKSAAQKRTDLPAWKTLENIKKSSDIKGLFESNNNRFNDFHATLEGFLYDYSKTTITAEIKDTLLDLAEQCDLKAERTDLFSGENVNLTEERAALHTALRTQDKTDLTIDGEEIDDFINATKQKIKIITEKIRNNPAIKNVVNIGIGGSDLGPHMVCHALQNQATGPAVHFVSNIDGAHLTRVLKQCEPQNTVFIVASKTFTTLETLTNADSAKKWLTDTLGADATQDHFIAVSSNVEGAVEYGINEDHILPLRDWIGGRYSVWSSIGLPIAINLGYDAFEQFLRGANAMDTHFQNADFGENIPVLMALLGVWHRNFCDYNTVATLPYAQNLERFPQYIQQLEMESNGKSVERSGKALNHQTNTIVFGEPGTNAQHAFFQLLHQGTEIVPCDFIIIAKPDHDLHHHHTHLVSNAIAQTAALMMGHKNTDEPYKNFPGNRPSCTLILPELNAYYLGMLMALYEHKTFVQGVIWDINSFDQWGVELGKEIAKTITDTIENPDQNDALDSSTNGLLKHLKTL